MSGAAVFAGGLLVGVVAEHHLPEGDGSLTVVPITWAERLPALTAILCSWRWVLSRSRGWRYSLQPRLFIGGPACCLTGRLFWSSGPGCWPRS